MVVHKRRTREIHNDLRKRLRETSYVSSTGGILHLGKVMNEMNLSFLLRWKGKCDGLEMVGSHPTLQIFRATECFVKKLDFVLKIRPHRVSLGLPVIVIIHQDLEPGVERYDHFKGA